MNAIQQEDKRPPMIGMQSGTSLLVVVFIVLCLVIMGVLSLSQVLKDRDYSLQVADENRAYYAAYSALQHDLMAALNDESRADGSLVLEEDINEELYLRMEVEFGDEISLGYEITSCRQIPKPKETKSDPLPVWKGQ